jgi:hypothetical protein
MAEFLLYAMYHSWDKEGIFQNPHRGKTGKAGFIEVRIEHTFPILPSEKHWSDW